MLTKVSLNSAATLSFAHANGISSHPIHRDSNWGESVVSYASDKLSMWWAPVQASTASSRGIVLAQIELEEAEVLD